MECLLQGLLEREKEGKARIESQDIEKKTKRQKMRKKVLKWRENKQWKGR